MEIVQAMAGFFIALLVVSAIMQIAFSYALQVISEKNELPEFASFLAWIPLLNLYPLIRSGGGDFRKFVLGIVGFVVLSGASVALSAGVGAAVGGIVMGVMAIAMLVYMVRIVMHTAESRGISKWVGLLLFVPLVNFFVYPYIAFHDGFRPPHKIGIAIGLLLAFGPIPGQIKMLDMITESAATMQAAAESGDFSEFAQSGDGDGFGDMMGGLGAAMQLGAQLSMLEGMDPNDPAQAETMRRQLGEIRAELAASSDALGPDTVSQLEEVLQQLEAAVPGGAPTQAMAGAGDSSATRERLAATPPITDSIARQGDRGFDVPLTVPCPVGTDMKGAGPPEGLKRWCSQPGDGLRHGWFTEWHPNGQPAIAGEYQDGLKVGVWTRWHPNGTKRVQAQFTDGLQAGALIAWNDAGGKVHEEQFVAGGPASR